MGGQPPSYWPDAIALFTAYLFGYSWCGVILYAMTAEKARLDPVAGAANLNALQWGWFATGGLLADSVAGPIYNYMVANHSGAQSCFMFSGYTFLAMAACGLLYKDETNIIKEFEDDCSSQLRKVGVSLNPYGPTRGAILSCIAFIFLTWAVTPDLFYGTTYYFYLSPEDGCLPDPNAVRITGRSGCSAAQGFAAMMNYP